MYVLIEDDIGRRLLLDLQCVACTRVDRVMLINLCLYQGPQGDDNQSVRGSTNTRFFEGDKI